MDQAGPLLPKVIRRTDYISIQQNTALWLPAIQVICQLHDLPTDMLTRFNGGTCIVFAAGENHIIKLYPPYWRHEFNVERKVAEYMFGKLEITIPEIQAYGDLEGWPYLIMDRLTGTYLCDIWDRMEDKNRLHIVTHLGEILASLHALSTSGLSHLEPNWTAFVQKRLRNCEQRYREKGLTEHWLQQTPAYLAHMSPLYPLNYKPALVIGDVHQFHLLVTEKYGLWRLCGLFDFDTAMIGFHEYDLASASLFMMSGRPQLLRAFFQTYGYAEIELNEALSARLMAYTLLHGYPYLDWVPKEVVINYSCSTLHEVANTIFDLKHL